MDNSEQFSNEINKLFETVKKQAMDYSNAFENFQMMQNEFNDLNSKINIFKNDFIQDMEKKSEQYDNKIRDFLQYVSLEYQKLKREYKTIKNINKLNDEQEKIVSDLKDLFKDSTEKFEEIYQKALEYQDDMQTYSNKIKKDAEKLLNELSKSFEDKINNSIEEKTNKVKDDIIFRQRKIEGLLKNNESELKGLQREFTINNNKFKESIEEIKLSIDNEDPAAKTYNKSLIDTLNVKIDEMNARFNTLEHEVSSVSRLIDSNDSKQNYNSVSSQDSSAIPFLNKKIKGFEDDITEQDKRVKTAYIVAFMSIVFALISILLTFV